MRLTATPQPPHHWPAVLKAVFQHDMCLLRRYHVAAPCELNIAVADSYVALRRYTAADFVLYALADEHGALAGMVGVEPESNVLVTFGLAVSHRAPAGLAELSRLVCNLCDRTQPIRCVLYQRNKPAQRFLRRLGFTADPTPLTHPATSQPGILFTLHP